MERNANRHTISPPVLKNPRITYEGVRRRWTEEWVGQPLTKDLLSILQNFCYCTFLPLISVMEKQGENQGVGDILKKPNRGVVNNVNTKLQ